MGKGQGRPKSTYRAARKNQERLMGRLKRHLASAPFPLHLGDVLWNNPRFEPVKETLLNKMLKPSHEKPEKVEPAPEPISVQAPVPPPAPKPKASFRRI